MRFFDTYEGWIEMAQEAYDFAQDVMSREPVGGSIYEANEWMAERLKPAIDVIAAGLGPGQLPWTDIDGRVYGPTGRGDFASQSSGGIRNSETIDYYYCAQYESQSGVDVCGTYVDTRDARSIRRGR